MIVYGIKINNQYITNHNKSGISNYWLTDNILKANKWVYKSGAERNAEKLKTKLRIIPVDVIQIEIKETKNESKTKPQKINSTLIL